MSAVGSETVVVSSDAVILTREQAERLLPILDQFADQFSGRRSFAAVILRHEISKQVQS